MESEPKWNRNGIGTGIVKTLASRHFSSLQQESSKMNVSLLITLGMTATIMIIMASIVHARPDLPSTASNISYADHSRTKRAVGVSAAMASAGASLLMRDGTTETWVWPNGSRQRISPASCFVDGSGPCPNANCYDGNGRKGQVIKETTVSCGFFCVWRAHCKTAICCS